MDLKANTHQGKWMKVNILCVEETNLKGEKIGGSCVAIITQNQLW